MAVSILPSFGSSLTLRLLKNAPVSYGTYRSICTTKCLAQGKHNNPKWKKLRTQKVMKVDLPNYEDTIRSWDEIPKEEARSIMKEKGVYPPQFHMERPYFLSTSGDVFDQYVPPEGDGKVSFISKEGAKQKMDFVGKKGKSMLAIRKLRKFDDEFEIDEFLVLAQDVYMKAHNAMMNVRKDKEELALWVTERAYPEMLHNAVDKTIHWKMIGLLEPPKLVQARSMDVLSKENLFCQLTVRFHTQQMLAVYDRFGRLMYGSEILAKDVLEYIVFERQISNKYGSWRIHAKIIPDWMPPKDAVPKTYRVSMEPAPTIEPETKAIPPPPSGDTPALATA